MYVHSLHYIPALIFCPLICPPCAEPHTPANDIKYYTLHRQPKKSAAAADPLRAFSHNIEIDSRLRAGYNTKSGVDPNRLRAFSYGAKLDSESNSAGEIRRQKSLEGYLDQPPVNGVGKRDKNTDDVLADNNPNVKRHSANGILMSPVTTKGEVTMTQSTKSSPSTTSPLTGRKVYAHKSPPPVSTTHKAPPQQSTCEKTERTSPPKTVLSSSVGSDDTIPLLQRGGSTSSSGTHSPPPGERRIIRQLPSSSREGSREPPDTVSNASDDLYEHLEYYKNERSSSLASSSSGSTKSTNSHSASSQRLFRASVSPESEGSGVYDHLPPSIEVSESEENAPEKLSSVSPSNCMMPRRVSSQPALSTPVSARESPIDHDQSTPSIAEEESSDDEAGTPTNR